MLIVTVYCAISLVISIVLSLLSFVIGTQFQAFIDEKSTRPVSATITLIIFILILMQASIVVFAQELN